MPRMNGFELLKKLRADELTSHIPIILLTAKADMESKMEGLLQGADAYLEKPFNSDELLVRIKKLLELRKMLQNFYLNKAGIGGVTQPKEALVNTLEIRDAGPAKEDTLLLKVREIISLHISDTGFTVEQLCKAVFMSHSKLQRKLNALTGCSPNKFIRLMRLNKAKALLEEGKTSIATIALECGYVDPGYFSRVFKQEFGVTPNEWKEM